MATKKRRGLQIFELRQVMKLEDTHENFENWLHKSYISSSLREQIRKAQIHFVPIENFRDKSQPVFPVKTEELLTYFRTHVENKNFVDICIEDKDYCELALHADSMTLGSFIITAIAVPIFVNIISSYIFEKLGKKQKNSNIKIAITVVIQTGESKKFEFEGRYCQ